VGIAAFFPFRTEDGGGGGKGGKKGGRAFRGRDARNQGRREGGRQLSPFHFSLADFKEEKEGGRKEGKREIRLAAVFLGGKIIRKRRGGGR